MSEITFKRCFTVTSEYETAILLGFFLLTLTFLPQNARGCTSALFCLGNVADENDKVETSEVLLLKTKKLPVDLKSMAYLSKRIKEMHEMIIAFCRQIQDKKEEPIKREGSSVWAGLFQTTLSMRGVSPDTQINQELQKPETMIYIIK